MSIPVDLADLDAAISARGTAAYVCTAGDGGGAPHVAHLAVTMEQGRLVCTAGRTSRANVAMRSGVCLLWPGPDDDYSLIVDGVAFCEDERLVITPERAVLHRPAPS